jgi:hypothetical protein
VGFENAATSQIEHGWHWSKLEFAKLTGSYCVKNWLLSGNFVFPTGPE